MEIKINETVIKKLEQSARLALLDTARFYVELVKQTMKSRGWSDTGALANSIYVREVGDTVQVWSRTVQAVIMEFGRKPLSKRPPMQSLVPWLNRKGIVKGNTLDSLSSKDKGTVYVMARSIGEKGIKPRRYFMDTYEENLDRMNKYYVQRFTYYFSK